MQLCSTNVREFISTFLQFIVVYPEGRLTIRIDGAVVERHWENPSRALSWTDEMKQEAKRKERERQECLKQHG